MASPSPGSVINLLENWNPKVKGGLHNNQIWQGLKGKSPQEIEAYAANLLKNPQVIHSFLGSIDPALAQKVHSNPIFRNLQNKSPDEIGTIITNLANTAGIFRR
jgi:hypothetical protein